MNASNVLHVHIYDLSEKGCPWKQSGSLALKPEFLSIELKIFFITRTKNDWSYAISFRSLLGNPPRHQQTIFAINK